MNNAIVKAAQKMGYTLDINDEDFDTVRGNVENWLNFGPLNTTVQDAIKYTYQGLDPWNCDNGCNSAIIL